MKGFGCLINRSVRFEAEGRGNMSLLDKLKTRNRPNREPDSLDIVEQVMEEEERRATNAAESGSPDWLRLANTVLVVMLVLFLLIAWHGR